MFIYYFLNLDASFGSTEVAVLDLLGRLDPMAEAAYREGEQMRARLGVLGEEPRLAKTVRIHAGQPVRGGAESVVPLTWEATGAPGLFPRMEADLVVAAVGPRLTQLSFRGSYRPPLGAFGRALDRTLLHRIAEASVKSFLDRFGALVEQEVRAAEGSAPGVDERVVAAAGGTPDPAGRGLGAP